MNSGNLAGWISIVLSLGLTFGWVAKNPPLEENEPQNYTPAPSQQDVEPTEDTEYAVTNSSNNNTPPSFETEDDMPTTFRELMAYSTIPELDIFYEVVVEKTEDLAYLSMEDLSILRNSVYAKHGYIFNDADMRELFNGCDWYSGTVPSSEFRDTVFSQVEMDLVAAILHEEGTR